MGKGNEWKLWGMEHGEAQGDREGQVAQVSCVKDLVFVLGITCADRKEF